MEHSNQNQMLHSQLYHYNESALATEVGVVPSIAMPTAPVPTTADYDYKESYSYMLNTTETNSVDNYSPVNSPFNLAVMNQQNQFASPMQHYADEKRKERGYESYEDKFRANSYPQGTQGALQGGAGAQVMMAQGQAQAGQGQHPQAGLPQGQLPQLPQGITGPGPVPPISTIQIPSNIDINKYPDMTTLLNSNSNILLPQVENQFVDHKSCTICGKRITRDMSRHMRTHQTESRFSCKFPKTQCRHKSGKFNRPYDYKKHLLNRHFKFDDPYIKRLHNLSDKLYHWGTCPCGSRHIGKDWLDKHILTEEEGKRCRCVE